MSFPRHRRGAPSPEPSSSDEEDAFSALARKKQKTSSAKQQKKPTMKIGLSVATEQPAKRNDVASMTSKADSKHKEPVVKSLTSSMKRHHGAISSSRKAKMESLLQELSHEQENSVKAEQFTRRQHQRAPGSFVQPGEEKITTNLFIGNLAPHLTEEQLSFEFARFGPLHSVKIMYARSNEERARNRHSGFVCFRHRLDAEVAMDQLDETDPFRVGRRIMIRWGRHVPEHGSGSAAKPPKEEDGNADHSVRMTKEKWKYRRPGAGLADLKLSSHEMEDFDRLFRRNLSTSRGDICNAMAFCFEHSGASRQICNMVQDLLEEKPASHLSNEAAVEVKIAQLFLLSDILFNSQQPGVRNAFRYRDAIEKLAPGAFAALGKMDFGGRWTRNKLSVAVSSVLGAWTNWSVYVPSFLDELHDRFEGREIKPKETKPKEIKQPETTPDETIEAPHTIGDEDEPEHQTSVSEGFEKRPKGDWAMVNSNEEHPGLGASNDGETTGHELPTVNATPSTSGVDDVDGESLHEDDVDGEPLDVDDVDGEPLDEEGERTLEESTSKISDDDGMALDDDDEDADGEPLDED